LNEKVLMSNQEFLQLFEEIAEKIKNFPEKFGSWTLLNEKIQKKLEKNIENRKVLENLPGFA